MNRINAGMCVLAVLLIGVGGCATEKDLIVIGWIGPLTGQSAVLGIDSATAAQIAVDEINAQGGINGREVRLVIEDDQYTVGNTMRAYQKLVHADGANIILVNTYGGVFALADRAKEDGVVLIDPLDCNRVLAGLGEHVFCLATDSESIGQVLAGHAEEKSVESVGILYWNSDQFMPLVKDTFVKEFEGEEYVYAYSAGTNDFRTPLLRMQEKNISAIVLLGYDETGNAMKQARDLGFEGQFYTTGTVTSPSLQKAAKGTAEGVILAFWDAPKNNMRTQQFESVFIDVQERPPLLDLATYPTYDAVHMVALAISDAQGDDAQAMATSLVNLRDVEGVTGTIRFDEQGAMRIRESAYKLVNGDVVQIE